jgi:predicted ribosome quality control (RQC) complex YloA/Tae2 family protein
VHNSYFLLRALAPVLAARLQGFTCVSCFCQHKDELMLEFHNGQHSFFIRALLGPSFSCLTFPDKIARARKNSIDLFGEAVMQPVQRVYVPAHERSLIIALNTHSICFKMHGNRANALLLKGNSVSDIFRKQLHSDYELRADTMARALDWSRAQFENSLGQLPQTYFVLDRTVWSYLNGRGFDHSSTDEKWRLFEACIKQLAQPAFHLAETSGLPVFSLLPLPDTGRTYTDPMEALNRFATAWLSAAAFTKARTAALARLAQSEKQTEKSIQTLQNRLHELAHGRPYRQWADLIMAHLHQIKPGEKSFTASDFNTPDEPVTIPLNPDIPPQQNAAVYYRKAKNQTIELQQLANALRQREEALQQIRARQQRVRAAQLPGDLDPEVDTGARRADAPQPFHRYEHMGYEILIGKNAAANDDLLRHAHKNDLWLHVKDAPGSHVIVRHKGTQPFPKPVIETAASWAAYHSKRKTEALVPVAHTLCKYVRKRKGDPPGAVVVERESTLLAPPLAP